MALVNLDTAAKLTLLKNAMSADLTDLGVVAGDATDGCVFTANSGSSYIVVGLNSGAVARTFTVKSGTFTQFAGADLASGNIAAGKQKAVWLDDIGKYIIASGTNKGKVKIDVSHAELKLAVLEIKKFSVSAT